MCSCDPAHYRWIQADGGSYCPCDMGGGVGRWGGAQMHLNCVARGRKKKILKLVIFFPSMFHVLLQTQSVSVNKNPGLGLVALFSREFKTIWLLLHWLFSGMLNWQEAKSQARGKTFFSIKKYSLGRKIQELSKRWHRFAVYYRITEPSAHPFKGQAYYAADVGKQSRGRRKGNILLSGCHINNLPYHFHEKRPKQRE